MEFVKLVGTEKQIAWATDIRDTAFGNIECLINNHKKEVELGFTPKYSLDAVEELRKQVVTAFSTDSPAKIINNRHIVIYEKMEAIAINITKKAANN